MTLEKFHQGEKILDDRYSRPEDELNTPEAVALNKRERDFNGRGGFRDLLKLKLAIESIGDVGFLGASDPDFIQQVIDDPKMYAYSALGFNTTEKDIDENRLEIALNKFLEDSKISIVKIIDEYLSVIIQYNAITESEALNELKFMLDECKRFVLSGDWKLYCKKATEAKSYLKGIECLLKLCCGVAVEDDSTREMLGIRRKRA